MTSKITYEPVHGDDEDNPSSSDQLSLHGSLLRTGSPKHNGTRNWVCTLIIVALITALASGGLCFFFGRRFERHIAELDWFSPPGTIDHKFTYRKEFAIRPGNQSQIWWDKVFPRGRGFIQHSEISPTPHGLAVFHQLHCLDAIRHGYWAARDQIEPDHFAQPGHIRHCIDYIRQSIMCNADTNLEPIDPDLGGVTGFGFTRKCRDIVRLIGWAEKWRTHNQKSHE